VLVELRLRGLGAIDAAELDFGSGFTAVTGETGAGKTMLLTGLALLLGGRGDAALVRDGYPRAEIEGRFRVPPDGGAVAAAVEQCGGALDGDEVVLARTIGADGRSRAFLGGRAVPVATLAGLADALVTVHGQADQRGLLRPVTQRSALDAFAGAAVAEPLRDYRSAFDELAVLRAELADLTGHRRQRALEADRLRQGVADVDELAPEPGEDVALRRHAARLGHADALRRAATAAHTALAAGSTEAAAAPSDHADVLSLIGAARRDLDALRGHDADLDALAARLAEASYLVADVAADLSSYADRIDADPARLAAVHERLSRLTALTRRYAADVDAARAARSEPAEPLAAADPATAGIGPGDPASGEPIPDEHGGEHGVGLDAVLIWAGEARERLAHLDDDDSRLNDLTARRTAVLATLTEAAQRLSAARSAAAARFAAAVSAELVGLAMADASLSVAVTQRPDPNGLPIAEQNVAFGPSGVDDIEFHLVAHAGAPMRPLHRGASGGELSRVMLAVEIVLAGVDAVPTFIFDEVDAGVGGRAAIEVGRRLAALAATAQVLVVTHLPQVAAFADRHLVVAKTAAGLVTSTEIDLVDGDSRLRELSRMLGGLADSSLAQDHAAELLDAAAAAKRPAGRRTTPREPATTAARTHRERTS
jgi:DNA repair protein RecN (Recombination protein N)